MQPDLPWNVAGIPPEAREAARAAARREGLSVGEWLTRRIMRTLAEVAEAASLYPAQATAAPSQSARDSAAMLESVSRSESETQTAYKRIEEQLRSVGRRLEASERSQTENNRAMNKAATEINIATREQAQAFDQLGAHVVGLADRITRVEQQTAQDGLKDAVRALHNGLSRVAEQIAQTANQSADQLAALAGNVESVAGKLVDARTEAENTAHTLEQRIAMIDERVRAVERAAHSSADALERTIANIERSQTDRGATAGEMQRQAQTLAQLGDTLDRLNARLSASEAQTSGAMARLEENVARVEAKSHDALSDRRLLGIETALSEIAGRLEHTERTAAGSNGNVEESLRSLANRVDAADKRHREALAELRNAVQDANGSLSNYEPAQTKAAAPPPPPSGPQSAGAPIFDLPPFPETAPPFAADTAPFTQGFQPPHNDPFAPPPFADPAPDASQPFSNNFGGDTFASAAQSNESFIQAARRSARAASAAEVPAQSGFPWSGRRAAPAGEEPAKTETTRYLLIIGLAVLVVIVVAAGFVLSRSFGDSHPVRTPANLNQILQKPKPAVSTELQPPAQPTMPGFTPPLGENDQTTANTTPSVTPPPATQSRPATANPSTMKPVPAQIPRSQQQAMTQTQAPISPVQKLAALANGGNVKAQAALGFAYLDGTSGIAVNEAEGARWLERAANGGDAMSAYRLGTLYERGHGVPTDAGKAVQFYSIAAKQGNRKAMHNLAVAFAEGSGVPKNLQQASQWFTKAAELGLSDSQFNLAVLYERGMGVQQSLTEAYKWYSIAAAQGDTESKARVDALATQLAPADKASAQKAADSFRPKPMNAAANAMPSASDFAG